MAATVQAQFFGAAAGLPPGVNAESGVTWNRQDTQTGTIPIPIPPAPGVNFSFLKVLQLAVTGTQAGGYIENRTVRLSGALPGGLAMHRKVDTQANWSTTFNQTAGSKAPTDTVGSNIAGTAPSGYTAITTGAVQYDNTTQATDSIGIGSAQLMGVLLAVDASYTGGPGAATPSTLGELILGYDER